MFNDSFAPAMALNIYETSVSDSSDAYTIASGEGSHAGNAKNLQLKAHYGQP